MCIFAVGSCVEPWIEMCKKSSCRLAGRVGSCVEPWIEISHESVSTFNTLSAPVWSRGLKYFYHQISMPGYRVGSCVEPWIEISLYSSTQVPSNVGSCVEPWIEIPFLYVILISSLVGSCVESWIEIILQPALISSPATSAPV